MFGFKKNKKLTKVEVKEVSPDFNLLNSKDICDVNWWKWDDGRIVLKVKIKINDYSVEKGFESKTFEETLDKLNKFWSENEAKIRAISEL